MRIENVLDEIAESDFISEDIEFLDLPFTGAVKEVEEAYLDSIIEDSKGGYVIDKEVIYPVLLLLIVADMAINNTVYYDEKNSDLGSVLLVHVPLAVDIFKKDMDRKSLFSKKPKNDMQKFKLKASECIEIILNAKDFTEDENYKVLRELLLDIKDRFLC